MILKSIKIIIQHDTLLLMILYVFFRKPKHGMVKHLPSCRFWLPPGCQRLVREIASQVAPSTSELTPHCVRMSPIVTVYIYIYMLIIYIYVLKCYICVDCIIFIYFSDMSIIHNYIIRLSIIDISLKYVHCSVILDMGLFESRVIWQKLMVDYHVLTKIAIPIALVQTNPYCYNLGPRQWCLLACNPIIYSYRKPWSLLEWCSPTYSSYRKQWPHIVMIIILI